MENNKLTFEEWFDILIGILQKKGYSTVDRDTAEIDYEDNKSPEESAKEFIKEWES